MEKLTFETNVPRSLKLHYAEGKRCPSNFGGDQFMFSTDQGPFYVSETVGNILHDQIRKQEVRAGELVEVCRREVDQGRGRKGINWVLTKCCSVGHQPDGAYAVPKLNGTNGYNGAGVASPAPQTAPTPEPPSNISGNGSTQNGNGHGNSNGNGPSPAALWSARVKAATQARLEMYIELCDWAAGRFDGRVSAGEVQSFLMNVLIGCDKNGGAR